MRMKPKTLAGFIILFLVLAMIPPVTGNGWPEEQTRHIIAHPPETGTDGDMFVTEAGIGHSGPLVTVLDPNMDIFGYLFFKDIKLNSYFHLVNATLRLHTASTLDFDNESAFTIYGIPDYRYFGMGEWGYGSPAEIMNAPLTSAYVNYNSSQFYGSQWHEIDVTNIVQELKSNPWYEGPGLSYYDPGDYMAFIILGAGGHDSRWFYDVSAGNDFEAQLHLHWDFNPPPPSGYPTAVYNQTYGKNYTIWFIPGMDQVTSVQNFTMLWDSSDEVYGFQEKTAYSNVTNRFYIFGGTDDEAGRSISYLTKTRTSGVWDGSFTLWDTVANATAGLYSDFHVWNNGTEDYLDVAWMDEHLADNKIYYCRYLLNVDGTATNLTDPQLIRSSSFNREPITIMVDSEGYPYVSFAHKDGLTNVGYVSWSTTNNGSFTHSTSSPAMVNGLLVLNPNTQYGPYIQELYRGGDRRMFLFLIVHHTAPLAKKYSLRNKDSSDDWDSEEEFGTDTQGPERRWAVSASSICDDGDSYNITLAWPEKTPTVSSLYFLERPTILLEDSGVHSHSDVVIMGATEDGFYYTVEHLVDTRYTQYRIRNGTWSENMTLRDFTEYGATHDIDLWSLTAQKYPVRYDNKTIVSYAWKDQLDDRFWHDWFYIEEGPVDATDPEFIVTDENGTVLVDDLTSLEDAEDWIDDYDPDPEDPDPAGEWSEGPGGETGAFTRFRMRLWFLIIGFGCFFGPVLFFSWRRPSGYYLMAGSIVMLIGLGLLMSIAQV